MILIENKFNVGERVYLIQQVPVHFDCNVCNGEGKFLYNNYKIRCPKCNGSGKLHDCNARVWKVIDDECKVSSIKASYNGHNISIRYKISGYNRLEENVFDTFEKAQIRCDELNHKSEGEVVDGSE